MEIFVFNKAGNISLLTVKRIARDVLCREKRKTAGLTIVFLNAGEIKKLNLKYRRKNCPTDVLSFGSKEQDYLGEVIICPEEVRKNAKENKIVFKKEMTRVLIHGLLHLLGYDHQKSRPQKQIMLSKQELYLSKVRFS
ncbi:MAG: rRNA maturation RNase YbeY [bacterium]|nr:rRNA maturation RNase YbeY [bacterium]